MSEPKLPSTSISDNPSAVAASAAQAAKENEALAASPLPPKTDDAPAVTDPKVKDLDAAPRAPIEDDDTNINDFLKIVDKPLIEEPKPKDDKTKLEVKPKEDAKKSEPPKVEAKHKEGEVKPTTSTKVERDLSGFEEAEQKLLRTMSNEAFNFVRPKLLENKQLGEVLKQKDVEIANLKVGKQLMPDSYYEHPQAFVLTPEYNDNIAVLNKASEIENYWAEQFAKIRQGDTWRDLDMDAKGNLIYGKTENKADAQSEALVMRYMNAAAQQVAQRRAAVMTLQQTYGDRHRKAIGVLKEAEKKHFAAYEDPKHPYAPVMKTIGDSIPVELRGSPLAPFVIKSATATIQLGHLVKQQQTEIAELKAKLAAGGNGAASAKTTTDKKDAGPTESDTTVATSEGKGGGEPEVTFDDFERVKREID